MAAESNGQVLRWGHVIVIHQLPDPGFPTDLAGQISSVATGPAARGRGIGSAVSA